MSTPAQGAGGVVAWWRSSLRLRVIITTMLLGTVVTVLVGTALFGQVAEGLVRQAVTAATADAAQEVRSVQASFDAMSRSDDSSLNATANDIIKGQVASADQAQRRSVLTRSLGNDRDARIATLASDDVEPDEIPEQLVGALEEDPRNQQVMVTDVEFSTSDQAVASVIVGARVDISRAGPHNLYLIYPMEREQATLDLIRQWFAVGGLALLILMGAVGWVASSMVASPVGQAARVSQQMARGHLDERLPVRGSDELDQLAMAFNTMADSIQSQIRQLETLSMLQQRFVSDVSHELRTPLTTIQMAGEVLYSARDDFSSPVARSAELLYEELDRFEDLLTELLEISRYDSGAADLEIDRVDLAGVVTQVLEALTALSAHTGSEVRVRVPDEPVLVEMDQRRVSRILRNVMANALDHGEGKPVDVILEEREHSVAVTIRDHGVGLTAEEAAMVFDRFWRSDPARNRTTGGTGLGLAISLEDAKLHGGYLQVAGAPGEGAAFRLVLPRRQDTPIADEPGPVPFPTDPVPTDSGLTDSGLTDSGLTDSGPTDSGPTDSGPTDSGPAGTDAAATRTEPLEKAATARGRAGKESST
ncbi:MtrAB system histidine kinase MtrB [Ornithinimicrobium sp. F0845]|uniref:MtrAB system histidine kinase MtrB n=1 Tax=Ornithinimicrobium sp. F0845 TaxID=2926412 RepID=UPI001FF17EE3|nr:MtrAB system histidine kinase MtrB [Ornithinimicrobium sp. F0845]MCK0111399.1 MtrAB system histidine kinase MtrB [Ornithinimicrobium sp. F0845]